MSYEIYTTEALVCGTKDHRTADRSYLLFTREAGMLFATARSVREERSRQRYALQEFSLIRVSLIRGRQEWRVGSVETERNFYHDAVDKAARGSVTSLVRHLRRFAGGETPDQKLYDDQVSMLSILADAVPNRPTFELMAVVRLLTNLGYVDSKTVPAVMLGVPSQDLFKQPDAVSHSILERLYTQAISVSHL